VRILAARLGFSGNDFAFEFLHSHF
jgi:hypothetical protein